MESVKVRGAMGRNRDSLTGKAKAVNPDEAQIYNTESYKLL